MGPMGDHWWPAFVAILLWSRTLVSWLVILHDHIMIKTFRIRIRMDQALYGREQCAAAKLASEAQRVGIAPA